MTTSDERRATGRAIQGQLWPAILKGPGGQFPAAIRFCEVVVRAEFEPQHSIDFIAPQSARDNDGNIGPRPDHPQKLEAFVGRPKIEHNKAGIAGEFFADIILARVSQGNINAVPLQ